MAKLDVYLRSIEKFGAVGAVLASGQAVTLRFPTGDRHATQVTPHDQLVGLVREVAPMPVLDQIDKNRPAKFEHESAGMRYAISVAPRPGLWQVTITGLANEATPPPAASAPSTRAGASGSEARSMTAPGAVGSDMVIERGQYDASAGDRPRPTASGSVLLDELTHAARSAHATDLYVATAAQALRRVDGKLAAVGGAIDGETLSREIGIVAPAEARAAWTERGAGVFAYGDGIGRVRVTLARDQRGPCAALRLLPDEPPPLDRLGVDPGRWLGGGGLFVIAGPSGSGKTVALSAFVRALGDRGRRTVAIEDPIEIVHAGPWISQRAVGPHVASVAAGVAAAHLEGADAIAVGAVTTADAANAIVEAVAGGHFVITTVTTPERPGDRLVLERLVDLIPVDRRELARVLLGNALLGLVYPTTAQGRTLEIAGVAH